MGQIDENDWSHGSMAVSVNGARIAGGCQMLCNWLIFKEVNKL